MAKVLGLAHQMSVCYESILEQLSDVTPGTIDS